MTKCMQQKTRAQNTFDPKRNKKDKTARRNRKFNTLQNKMVGEQEVDWKRGGNKDNLAQNVSKHLKKIIKNREKKNLVDTDGNVLS